MENRKQRTRPSYASSGHYGLTGFSLRQPSLGVGTLAKVTLIACSVIPGPRPSLGHLAQLYLAQPWHLG